MRSTLIYEEWRPIKNYIGLYEASNFGRIRSLNFGKIRVLKPGKLKKGYLLARLCKDGIAKMFYVHRLVWEAFNGEIPKDMEVNHINEIKTDNSIWNLNLMTPKENINWGTGIKRRREKLINGKCSKSLLQLTLDGQLVKEWSSMREAGRNGFDQSNVSACCMGKLKSHKGFKWRKKEDI